MIRKYSTTKMMTATLPNVDNGSDLIGPLFFLPKSDNHKGEGGLRKKGYFKKSFENKPLITIITVVFNGECFLEDTILSILHQTYDNVEYIIIDGGSTDRTLEVIKKYEHAIDYWVSETDRGIYDAMNKGISLTTGEWINFMNAGDSFVDNSILKSIESSFQKHNDVIYGDVVANYNNFQKTYNAKVLDISLNGIPYSHQSVFIKSIFAQKFPFDTQYSIVADFNQYVHLQAVNAHFYYVGIPISIISIGGLSETNRYSVLLQKKRVLENAYGKKKLLTLHYFSHLFLLRFKEILKSIIGTNISSFLIKFLKKS